MGLAEAGVTVACVESLRVYVCGVCLYVYVYCV